MYAPWLKINVIFFGAWVTGKKWKMWWQTTKKVQRTLRRAERKFCLHQSWETATKQGILIMPDSSWAVYECREDSRTEPKPVISLSLQNQHPCRRCELGPWRSFIVSLQPLNAEELGYHPSPTTAPSLLVGRNGTSKAVICVCDLSLTCKNRESSVTSLG